MTSKLAWLAGAIVLIAGCGGVETLSFPTPPPTPASSTTTVAHDLTEAPVNGVGGNPTTSVVLGPGGATLSGIVLGPGGPVGAATVHIERLVDDAVGTYNVTAQADGTWVLPAILGGRYRVRAWRSPDFDMTSPQIFFLGGTDNKSMTLSVAQFSAGNIAVAITPNPPVVSEPANLLIQLTADTVDANGVVHAAPVPAASIQLAGGAEIAVAAPNPVITTANGQAIWQVVCQTPGAVSLTATVNSGSSYPVNVPGCVAGVPPTTLPTTSTTTSSTSSSSTTSTTVATQTTTTVRH
jgi:hypothetical protein